MDVTTSYTAKQGASAFIPSLALMVRMNSELVAAESKVTRHWSPFSRVIRCVIDFLQHTVG